MEVKYSVSEAKNVELIRAGGIEYKPLCIVSHLNILAFTKAIVTNNKGEGRCQYFAVFIADINTPYEAHKIYQGKHEYNDLVFSTDGKLLLVVNREGHVMLFLNSGSLHEWTNSHTWIWDSETIVHTSFFHSKGQLSIQMADVKINAPYSDKFKSNEHYPTLRSLGGGYEEGFYVIVGSGVFIACTFDTEGKPKEEARACFGMQREKINKATSGLLKDGKVCVTTWRLNSNLFETWSIKLSHVINGKKKCEKNLFLSKPKLFINIERDETFEPITHATDKVTEVTCVPITFQYGNRHDKNTLFVTIKVVKGDPDFKEFVKAISENKRQEYESVNYCYMVQKYQRVEKSRPILNFSLKPEYDNKFQVYKGWEMQGEWMSTIRITCVAMSPKPLCNSTQVPNILIVATKGGYVYTINKETMTQTGKCFLFNHRTDEMPPPKRACDDKKVFSMCPTWTSLHLVAIDSSHNLHVTSLLRQSDLGSSYAIYIMLLLEYSIVSGSDYLDILMAMPPNSASTLADRISDTFQQHPIQFVQHLLVRFLMVKNSILRLSVGLHLKSIESRLQAHLSSIVKFFRLYRPITIDSITSENDLFSHVQSFIESRNSLEMYDLEKAVDTILYTYNVNDLQVDSSFAYDMQFALQFATEMSLYLMLLLVQNPKFELIKDTKTLLYLRELLLISRVWQRHKPLVFPQVLKKSDSVDIWATIYRNLTKLSHILPSELDAAFIDEIVTLETQVAYREMPLLIPLRGVISCIASAPTTELPYPLQFQSDQDEPSTNTSSLNPRRLEGSLNITKRFDHIRFRYIGIKESTLRCTRCFHLRTLANDNEDYVPIWEQQWASNCVCGGYWSIYNPK